MPEPEIRYPCPVCLGVKLSKIPVVAKENLTLDRCGRCGGIWFDEGEVARLRTVRPERVRQRIRPSNSAFRMVCHNCHGFLNRNAEKCDSCGWKNVLDCPICSRAMQRRLVQGWYLDFCTACRGVWFDQIELAEIWNLQLDRQAASQRMRGKDVAEGTAMVADVALDILFWSPDLAVWGADAVGSGARAVASGVVNLAGETPEAVGGAIEAAGELAGGVFEAIAEVVGAVFN